MTGSSFGGRRRGQEKRRDSLGPPSSRSKRRRVPYWASFFVLVVVLAAVTGAFVLWVLPSRFVFTSGLPSPGVSFPVSGTPFSAPDLVLVEPRPMPDLPEQVAEEVPEDPPPPEPGPAERLWAEVGPLMEAGDDPAALPLFAEYLQDHPDDLDAWLEYGVALVRSGRTGEGEEAFRRVALERGDRRAFLEWAAVLRDREAWEPAAEIYTTLLAEEPGDVAVRVELGRTFAADGRLDRAREEYEWVLSQEPGRHELRLELARVLWADDRAQEAARAAGEIPVTAAAYQDAERLQEEIALALAPPEVEAEEPETDPLVLAQVAIEEDDSEAVRAFFREDRAAGDLPADRALEWADLFQYRLEDPSTAISLLEERARIEPPTPQLRLRLARLYVWVGADELAQDEVRELLAETDGESPEAWALLGDLQRWEGLRPRSAEAYARALSLDPQEPQAREGRQRLSEETRLFVRATEDPGVGIMGSGFRDSEGFHVFDVSARGAVLRRGDLGASVQSGYRSLRGERADLSIGRDEGAFAELDLFHWWREGTVRAGLTLGVEHLQEGRTEPLLGARFEARQLGHWGFQGAYERRRGYALLSTIQSLDRQIQADRVSVAVEGRPGRTWSVSTNVDAAALSSQDGRNWRLGAGASAYRDLTRTSRVGLTSRILSFSEAAPRELDQRGYWDPELFWSSGVPVEIRTVRHEGWSVFARLTPGAALVQERGGSDSSWSAQLEGEGGVRYLGEQMSFNVNLFSMRGREGGYHASGLSFGMTLRR